jgi:rod shape determining protein RodA
VNLVRPAEQDRQPSRIVSCLYQLDYLLILFVLATTAFGIIVLEGATGGVPGLTKIVSRQMMWWAVSAAVFLFALLTPYRWLQFLGWPFYALCLGLLIALLVAGHGPIGFLTGIKAGGASSWLEAPLGGQSVRFQPSEFAKIAVVTVLSHWLAWRRRRLGNVLETIPPLLLVAMPVIIIAKQPDYGTAATFLPLPFLLLFVAGIPWRVVLTVTVVGIMAAAGGLYYLATAESIPGLTGNKKDRIRVFIEPVRGMFKPPGVEDILSGAAGQREPDQGKRKPSEKDPATWTIQQAEMALGSGQITGKGWKKGSQSRLRFLPARHTDFIFSALGEQFGLVGCLALLGLYVLIVWRAALIAIVSPDPFGKYLVIGLVSIVLIHLFINIGMVLRLLPIMGIPLPLISYGGSFLATNYLIFGIIANVGMRRGEAQERLAQSATRLFDPAPRGEASA